MLKHQPRIAGRSAVKNLFLGWALLVGTAVGLLAEVVKGPTVEYQELAFYPKRWVEKDAPSEMESWVGKHVAFLALPGKFDEKVMSDFVGVLDDGWETYLDFTGKAPRARKTVEGRAPIAAVPGNGLTCGAGCGFVGVTGIEVQGFYRSHYKTIKKNVKAVPHLYFYEMGRNFFTFGPRHDCFRTGFAVFMRYVCLDKLEIKDGDKRTRKVIEKAIDQYAKLRLEFLPTFTNAYGLGEKKNRLKDRPTDQPVMYASAMLKLHQELGDDWVRAFYRQVSDLPQGNGQDPAGARLQGLGWYLAASVAARRDLSEFFVKQWRFPLTEKEAAVLADVDWEEEGLAAGDLVKKLTSS